MNFKSKMMRNKDAKNRKKSANRILFVTSCICIVFFLLSMRLVYIMVFKNKEYYSMAEDQWRSQNVVKARRGNILDRNGEVLATSIDVYRIDLDLDALRKNEEIEIPDVAKDLAMALEMDESSVLEVLESKDADGDPAMSATLARSIEKDMADKVKALDIYGVIVSADTKRFYPNNNFLAHGLGSVNSDNVGLNGIELEYDKYLSGLPGIRVVDVDGAASPLPSNNAVFTAPIPGKDISLTIDENVQYMVEKIAEKAIVDNKAKSVSIIAMNPNNGEILGMTNKPDFNPNNIYEDYYSFSGENDGEKLQNMFNNSLVSDNFEPGSTFKNFSMMAAIEEDVVPENHIFQCNGGTKFGNITVKCWKLEGHGPQTLAQILQNSCNVGFMELAEMLGKEKLNEYINKYGFGKITGIDLPGEATGIVKRIDNISEVDLATISFGQTNTVTAMQLIAGFNAIANGGDIIQPHIMKEISHVDTSGAKVIDETFIPEVQENVMSDESIVIMKDYLEKTINDGGPVGTFMGTEYRVAAKTGTAEKADPVLGGYAKDKYIASVLAMYPVDNPQVTIYIKVDEPDPSNYYGGPVTKPLLKTFIQEFHQYMNSSLYKENYKEKEKKVVPDVRGKSVKEAEEILKSSGLQYSINGDETTVTNMSPIPGSVVYENTKIALNLKGDEKDSNKIIMPDLNGYTAEQVKELADKVGFKYTSSGTGTVVKQSIAKGQTIEKGTKVQLKFE